MSPDPTPLEALGKLAEMISESGEGTPLPPAADLSTLLAAVHASDLADLIEAAPPEAQLALFEAIPADEEAAEVLACMDEGGRERLLARLPISRKVELVSELAYDDAADVVSELPEEEQARVLAQLDEEDAAEVRGLAAYPPDSAGGLMNTEFISVEQGQTVRRALMQIKTGDLDWEDASEVFVVAPDQRLVGRIELNDLLRARLNDDVTELMEEDPACIHVMADQEEAAQKAAHYRVPLLPVVDDDQHLVGAISYDDVMEALGDEASEDMFRLAGTFDTHPARESLLARLASRFPFQVLTVFGTYVAALLIQLFYPGEAGILAFIPMIAALAGSAGIQTATTMIRGYATGEIRPADFRLVLNREFFLGVLTGAAAAVVELLFLAVTQPSSDYLVVVPVAQAISVILATVLATVVPFACLKFHMRAFGRELRIDPALAAGPFITTVNDIVATGVALGLSIYLVGK